jgi:hypothetical protein
VVPAVRNHAERREEAMTVWRELKEEALSAIRTGNTPEKEDR